MTSTTNLFNRESAAVEVLDPKDAERMLSRVAKQSTRVMVDAGYATYIAHRSGVANGRMAEIFGKSTSTITLYRRLGVALIAGVEPGTPTWNVLANKSKANHKDSGLASLLDAEDGIPSLDEIESTWQAHFKPDGKPVVEPTRDAQPSTDGVAPEVEVTALIKRLDALVKQFDAEQFAPIETALNALISRQVKRLAKVGETVSEDAKVA